MKAHLNNIIALLCISGALLPVAAQGDQDYNKVDAFTSGSVRKSLKVDSMIVFRTKAFVYWSEYWEDDMEVLSYRIKWGTVAASFQDSINKKPYEAKTPLIDTLQPLAENTEYVGQFYRDYNRKEFNVDFKFNTPPLPNSIGSPVPRAKLTGNVTGIEIYTINGKKVLSNILDGKLTPAAALHSVKNPGLYIVNLKGMNGRIIRSDKMLIGG